jgi:hypothetical protein
MDSVTETRLAKNEVFFRDLNESIRGAVDRYGTDGHVYEFICECSNPACTDRVSLTTAEYERVRSDPRRFVIASGHDVAAIEIVVAAHGDHEIVEKSGLAAEVAAELDPRAAA